MTRLEYCFNAILRVQMVKNMCETTRASKFAIKDCLKKNSLIHLLLILSMSPMHPSFSRDSIRSLIRYITSLHPFHLAINFILYPFYQLISSHVLCPFDFRLYFYAPLNCSLCWYSWLYAMLFLPVLNLILLRSAN